MMKKLIHIIICLTLLCWGGMSCQNEELPDMSAPECDEILFDVPTVTVNEEGFSRGVTGDTLKKTTLKNGETFAVWGYCVPYTVGTNTLAYASATSPWLTKRNQSAAHIFNNGLNVVTVGGGQTVAKKWYKAGYDLDGTTVNANVGSDAESYQYTFFAYYPAGDTGFKINPDASDNNQFTKGDTLVVRYTMPYNGTASSPSSVKLSDNTYLTNDAMIAMVENHKKANGKVSFTFSHLLTALSFEINNYTEYEDEEGTQYGKNLIIKRIRLGGTFHKTLRADLFKSSSENFSFHDTYRAIYTIFEGSQTVPYINEPTTVDDETSQVLGEPLLLLCGMQEDGTDKYLGPNPYQSVDENKSLEVGCPI